MRRVFAALAVIVSIGALAGLYASAAAAAAPPRGTLSGTEYTQLSAQEVATNQALGGKTINWTKVNRACRRAGTSTSLLVTQRDSCLDESRTLDVLASFVGEKAKCAAAFKSRSTTTTGTTTAGTSTSTTNFLDSAAFQEAVCLNPDYQSLGRAARAMYATDISARKKALSRGLAGLCLATLVDTPAVLRHEERFVFTTKALAADVALFTKIGRGKAPIRELNPTELEHDATDFEAAAKVLLSANQPDKLSACQHD